MIQTNYQHRETAAKQAETMINTFTEHYFKQQQVGCAGELIGRYRDQLKQVSSNAFKNALNRLSRGEDPAIVMQQLEHLLLNKILHKPTIKLRDAAYNDRNEVLQIVKELYDL